MTRAGGILKGNEKCYEESKSFFSINKNLGKASMIITPLFFFLSEIIHPRSETETVKELMSVANNYWVWYFAHIFALIAIIFLPFAILNLINYIDNKNISTYYIGCILSFIGIVGVSGYTAFDLIVWQIGINPNQEAMINLYEQITQSLGFSIPFLIIGPLLLVVGISVISIALYRAKNIKKWKSILVLIGILLYGLAGPLIPVENGHFIVIVGAGLMFVGLGSIVFEKECNMVSSPIN